MLRLYPQNGVGADQKVPKWVTAVFLAEDSQRCPLAPTIGTNTSDEARSMVSKRGLTHGSASASIKLVRFFLSIIFWLDQALPQEACVPAGCKSGMQLIPLEQVQIHTFKSKPSPLKCKEVQIGILASPHRQCSLVVSGVPLPGSPAWMTEWARVDS